MRPLLWCGLFAVTISCNPQPQSPQPQPPKIWDVNASDLHRSYVDFSDRWTGQRVRIVIAADSYQIAGAAIHWHARRPTEPPSIVFRSNEFPSVGNRPVEIVGTVQGKVADGLKRTYGDGWYVAVTECEIRSR